ncbi:MAG: proline--tRNA ligase [Caldisericia bacterium]|nr:proline--tRNA ligase [Caldisericia bacterium]
MNYSKAYIKTLKETPQDAEVSSHQLMIRAGMIKKVSTGVYTWLPLGLRVLEKIKSIIREELNKKDCNELLLPILLPSTPWKQTGRWTEYGQEMFKLNDRGQREFCLGPTHEEIITETAKNNLRSYRDLPAFLYQIQTKFRDEARPRFGVIRCKEFIMKDLYSFHADSDSLHKGYKDISQAYRNIFFKCGLNFYSVDADNGTIGGSFSHEYVSESEVGETEFAICASCGYTATIEVAPTAIKNEESGTSDSKDITEVNTPNIKSIDEVSKFFETQPDKILKTLLYADEKKNNYLVVVRGCDEVNETKLRKVLHKNLILSSDKSLPTGFIGPVSDKNIPIIADTLATGLKDCICGAMKKDTHFKHVYYGKDWEAIKVEDIRSLNDGDPCPNCNKQLSIKHGMEIGHTFVLNDRYSKPLKANYTAKEGGLKPILMGCYGIGVTRLVAAIIEQYHDDKGICWPASVAPYQIEIIVINSNNEKQIQTAKNLSELFTKDGYDVLVDDRDVSPGFKFKDAELIGIPYQITCGRGLENNTVEYNDRKHPNKQEIPLTNVTDFICKEIEKELDEQKRNSDNSSI